MTKVIDSVSSDVPAAWAEVITLGRTQASRGHLSAKELAMVSESDTSLYLLSKARSVAGRAGRCDLVSAIGT